MTTTTLPGSDSPDNLPLLTQVVETDTPDDLPTLTEIVADSLNAATDAEDIPPAVFAAPENEPDTPEPAVPELTASEPGIPETEPSDESQSIISQEAGLPEVAIPQPRVLSDEELQQILHHLEVHLETMLASKFSLHFEKLRDALDAHLDSKLQ